MVAPDCCGGSEVERRTVARRRRRPQHTTDAALRCAATSCRRRTTVDARLAGKDTLLHPAYSLTERCRVGGRERERRRESTPRAMLEEHGSQGSTLSVVTMAVATPACLQVCGCHTDRQAAAPAATATSTQHAASQWLLHQEVSGTTRCLEANKSERERAR